MKHIKERSEFLNESYKTSSYKFRPYTSHNPNVDILEFKWDNDTIITYGIYIKDTNSNKKGDEFMEIYSGGNYVLNSTKRNRSSYYAPDKIPSKYKSAWLDMKKDYDNYYK